ncbi:MAG: hypothetical protein KAH33_01765 [Candidatus Delongbacteria bacterium]|nr:hypothetical protein [Candidatus Delongbacteria bacterium]
MYKKLTILFLTIIISTAFFISCSDDDGTTPPPDLEITITSPNGGEIWYAYTAQTITWEDNIDGNVNIYLTDMVTFVEGISLGTESDGSFEYNIPSNVPTGSNLKISVVSVDDDNIGDFSDENLEVLSSP